MEKLDYNKPLGQLIEDLRRISKETLRAKRELGTGISPLLRTESEQVANPPAQRPAPKQTYQKPRNNHFGNRNWGGWNRPTMVNRLGIHNHVTKIGRFSSFRSTFRYGGPRQDLRHRIITRKFNKTGSGMDLRDKLFLHRASEKYIQFRKQHAELRKKNSPARAARRVQLLAQMLGSQQVNFVNESLQGYMERASQSGPRVDNFFGQPVRPAPLPPVPQQYFGRENNNSGFARLGSVANNFSGHFDDGCAPGYPTTRQGFVRAESIGSSAPGHLEDIHASGYPAIRRGFARAGSVASSVPGYFEDGPAAGYPTTRQGFVRAGSVASDVPGHFEDGPAAGYPPTRQGFVRSGSVPSSVSGSFEDEFAPAYPIHRTAPLAESYYSNRGSAAASTAGSQLPYSFEPADRFAANTGARPRYRVVNGVAYQSIGRVLPTQYGDPSWSQVHIESRPGMF